MTAKPPKKPLLILHLEDDASFSRKFKQKLSDEGFNVKVDLVKSRKEFTQQLAKQPYHIIFLDDHLPDCNGLEALNIVKEMQLPSSVVMLSDILDEVAIVNSISQGAVDYLLKTNLDRLPEVVRRVISNNLKNKTNVDFRKFFETSPDLLCSCDKEGNFINLNQAWTRVLGYSVKELKAKPFIELVYSEDRKAILNTFQSLINEKDKNGGIFTGCFTTRSGEMRWLQWNVTSQMDGVIYAIARDITDLKQHEIRLNQEQENLKELIEQYKAEVTKKSLVADQVQDSVVTTDLKGIITSWNKGSERVFGYSQQEAIGQHIEILYPAKDYKLIQNEGSNILLEQGSQEFEIQMLRKSGEIFDARLSLTVTRDNAGKVNGMVGYAVDLGTAVPASQGEGEAGSHNAGRFDTLLNSGPVITFSCEAKDGHKLTYISSNVESLFGLPVEQCLQEKDFFLNQLHPDDYEKWLETLKNLPESGSSSQVYRFKTADGEYRWTQYELVSVKDADGNPQEIAGMLLDVDDRHDAQQQLDVEKQKSEQTQQKLHSLEQELHQHEQKLHNTEEQLQQLEQRRQQAEQQLKEAEARLQQSQQQHSEEQQADTGRTDRDMLDVQLQAAMQEVERANQAKSEFLSSISHELRIALNAILGFTQVLALDETLNDNQKQYLGEISGAGNHLLGVVTNVIDLIKLESGKSDLHNETITVTQLVAECIEQLADKTKAKNVILTAANPDSAAHLCAYTDKERLKQVLLYTIASAIKYSNDGDKVEVLFGSENGDVRIGIKNSNTNFLKDGQAPLLHSYDLQEQHQKGLSSPRIELLITQTLLELMGGTIQYVFDPEKVVAILVPQASEQQDNGHIQLADTAEVPASPDPVPATNEPVILYIEDNPANVRLVETLLTQRPKYRLVAAQNPEKGLDLLRQHSPVLILLDMNLSNNNSYDVLAQFHKEPASQDIPVIAVSTDTAAGDVEKALNAGFSEYLTKPLEINRLLKAVDTLTAPADIAALQQINAK